jgi:hypothetical protein
VLKKVIFGAVLMFGSLLAMNDVTFAAECKAALTGRSDGTHIVKEMAQIAARGVWRTTASAKFGADWSSWSNAQSKSLKCDRIGTKYQCTASGKPCH